MSFLQALQKVRVLLCLFEKRGDVEVPGKVRRDVDTQKIESSDPLYLSLVNKDNGVFVAPQGLPVVHNQFFWFSGC